MGAHYTGMIPCHWNKEHFFNNIVCVYVCVGGFNLGIESLGPESHFPVEREIE